MHLGARGPVLPGPPVQRRSVPSVVLDPRPRSLDVRCGGDLQPVLHGLSVGWFAAQRHDHRGRHPDHIAGAREDGGGHLCHRLHRAVGPADPGHLAVRSDGRAAGGVGLAVAQISVVRPVRSIGRELAGDFGARLVGDRERDDRAVLHADREWLTRHQVDGVEGRAGTDLGCRRDQSGAGRNEHQGSDGEQHGRKQARRMWLTHHRSSSARCRRRISMARGRGAIGATRRSPGSAGESERRSSGHRRGDQIPHLRCLQPHLLGRAVVGLGLRAPLGVHPGLVDLDLPGRLRRPSSRAPAP